MDALISPCGKYRYWLTRNIESLFPSSSCIIWVMLNPSTADASLDDPTIRKCIGFTKRLRCKKLVVINLFAFRATHPKELKKAEDPFGPDNEDWQHSILTRMADTPNRIIAAWGIHGTLLNAGDDFKSILTEKNKPAWCLGLTKNGQPKHPLMVPYDTPLVPLTESTQ